MDIQAILRRFQPVRVAKAEVDVRLTHAESVAIAQVEPACLDMTRAGRRFTLGISAAVTGIAPVQAIPTTAAQWVIWNADPAKSYFFEELGEILLSGTPGLGGSLWGCLLTAPAQVGASAAGLAVQSLSQGGPASKALIKSAVTITGPAAPAWFQIAESADGVTAAAFSTGYANGFSRKDLAGAIAVSPGQGLGLAVMAPAGTTPLYGPQGRWIELETDME